MIFNISMIIASIYAGFLVWYVMTAFISGTVYTYLAYIAVILIGGSTFIAMYKVPDMMFANKKIKHILLLPISVHDVIFVLMKKLIVLQLALCTVFLWPCLIYFSRNILAVVIAFLSCMLIILFIDMLIFILTIIVIMAVQVRFAGTSLLVLQYLCPFFVLWSMGMGFHIVPKMEMHWICCILCAAMIGCLVIKMQQKKIYVLYQETYQKLQGHQHKQRKIFYSSCRIQDPYAFLEWKRVIRNKNLFLFSNIKNIFTIFIVVEFLSRDILPHELFAPYQIEILFLTICAAVNTISSTAYTSDPDQAFYSFLPMSSRKVFYCKTLHGALWGEGVVLAYWIFLVILKKTAVIPAFLLLLYGTFINYDCALLGVLFDYRMKREVCSTNELLHGNFSKFFVLVIALLWYTFMFWMQQKYIIDQFLLLVMSGSVVFCICEHVYIEEVWHDRGM